MMKFGHLCKEQGPKFGLPIKLISDNFGLMARLSVKLPNHATAIYVYGTRLCGGLAVPQRQELWALNSRFGSQQRCGRQRASTLKSFI